MPGLVGQFCQMESTLTFESPKSLSVLSEKGIGVWKGDKKSRGDSHIKRGGKFWILVSLRVFWEKRRILGLRGK